MNYDTARSEITLVDHPLVQARMTQLRDRGTGTELFRQILREISIPLALSALRHMETKDCRVHTPLCETEGKKLGSAVMIIPVLRAGLGFAEGMLQILPFASIGHIGMYRNETTHEPEHYYFRVPPGVAEAEILLVDPMLATGNSAVAAVDLLKKHGARKIHFVGLVGCPHGVARLKSAHPDVGIHLAALDPGLNENCYIVPGLGDAGDRYFGTEPV